MLGLSLAVLGVLLALGAWAQVAVGLRPLRALQRSLLESNSRSYRYVADLLAREFVGDEGQRQRYMELLAEHHAAKDIRETGAEALPAVDLAEVADYDDSGVVAEAVEELSESPMSLEDAMRTLGFSEEEIQNARKPGDQGGPQEARSDEPGSPEGGGQTGDGQAAPRTVGDGGESGDREGETAVVEAQVAQKGAPLYASRPVTNAGDIIAWAHSQGFKTTLPAEDLHVTVAYSTAPMDGATVPATGKSIKVAGDKRSVETLGDEGAVVLKFSSKALQVRWQQYRDAGASWDYDGYQPHITLTYDGQGVDLSKVEPYRGAIVLGAETQEALNEDKADEYVEAPTPEQPSPPPVAESQAPAPSEPGDRGVAPAQDGVAPPQGKPGEKWHYRSTEPGMPMREIPAERMKDAREVSDLVPGLRFLAHRDMGDGKTWSVTERNTGLTLTTGHTTAELADFAARQRVQQVGADKVQARVRETLQQSGLSEGEALGVTAEPRKGKVPGLDEVVAAYKRAVGGELDANMNATAVAFHRALADQNVKTIRDLAHPENPKSRAVIEALSGKKLARGAMQSANIAEGWLRSLHPKPVTPQVPAPAPNAAAPVSTQAPAPAAGATVAAAPATPTDPVAKRRAVLQALRDCIAG